MFKRLQYKFSSLSKCLSFDNPLQIIFSHVFFPKGTHAYVWKGKTLLVDGKRGETAGGLHAVLATSEYKQFLDRIATSEPVNIMDLGANIGSFSVLASQYFPQIRKLLLVEGDETVIPRLNYNISQSFGAASRPEVIHAAVCAHDGEVTFYQNPISVGSGVQNHASSGTAIETVVPAVSLRSLLRRFPDNQSVDVCKMDIEGSEFDAVYGLSEDELKRFKFFVMELHGTSTQNDEFIKFLGDAGFDHWSSDESGNPRTHAFIRR